MNTDKQLISVIIPVYNVECYIRTCIDSLLRQSYTRIEVLLIDDGSTDGSGNICDSYATEDSRVKVFHIENGGAAHARNYGIEKAIGEYLIFVDSDDFVDCSYVEKLYSLIKNDDIDLGICSYYDFFDMGEIKHELNCHTVDSLSGNIFNDYHMLGERLFYPVLKIYKMDIVKKYNIFFPEDMVTAEDQVFNYRYLSHVNKYKYLNECLYAYRKGNSESLASKIDDKSYYSEVKNLRLKRRFFDNFNVRYKKSMLLGHYIWMVEKYKRIEDNCLKYIMYEDDDELSLKDRIKLYILKNHLLIVILTMRRLKKISSLEVLGMINLRIKGVYI